MATPFSLLPEAGNEFPMEALADLQTARRFWQLLPEAGPEHPATNEGRPDGVYLWSCHGIARALADILDLKWKVYDGYFGRTGNEHAWLQHRVSRDMNLILDVYPIAAYSGPILVNGVLRGGWGTAYIEAGMQYDQETLEIYQREGIQALFAYKKALASAGNAKMKG